MSNRPTVHLLTLLVGLALAVPALGRTVPITQLPFVIEQPGVYELVAPLTGMQGIVIHSDHVTVDLKGFALLGLPGSGDGVFVRGPHRNIAVVNGTVAGWGAHGVMADGAFNGAFRDLRVSGNVLCGLRAGRGAVIQGVSSMANMGSGVFAFDAAVVRDVSSTGNGAWGLEVGRGSVVTDVCLVGNLGGGLFADQGARIVDNAIRGNGDPDTPLDPQPEAPPCSLASRAGLAVLGSGSYIEDNAVSGNAIGLQLFSAGNVVLDNLVAGNVDNYDLAPGNQLELLLCELPESIDWPARVTLAGSLEGLPGSAGIHVTSDDVTIDLAGHALVGVPGSLCGVFVDEVVQNLVVMNGVVRDWDGCGVRAFKVGNGRYEGLQLQGNGVYGLKVGPGSVVRGVAARDNQVDGIITLQDCLVRDCTATGNGNDGIQLGRQSQLESSVCSENAVFGVRTENGATVRECTVSGNGLGIAATAGSSVIDNTVTGNGAVGIRVEERSLVRGNTVSNEHTGIELVAGFGTRVEANSVSLAQIGVRAAQPGNLILGNSVSATAQPFLLAAGNHHGTIVDLTGVEVFDVGPWSNLVF